ncbi:MAG: hypothetical protein IPM13_09830 [Phycisphaerales bacterium]|nr:hypothetical protein [Phycisphaerales bacterium]
MSIPKLLLLTGTSPDEPGVGGVWLRDILGLFPPDRLACFAVAAPGDGRCTRGLGNRFDTCAYPCAYPQTWVQGRLRRGLHAARLAWVRGWRERALVARVVSFARGQGVERVWAIPERPHMFRIAREVSRALCCPLYATIWDPPEAVAMTHHLDRLSTDVMLRDFDALMRGLVACSVMSEGMQARYAPRYGVRSVILRHGIDEALWMPPGPRPQSDERLMIGFAGTANGPGEWRALVAALNSTRWKLDGRQVVLRTLSHSICESTPAEAHIEHLGYRPLPDVVQHLSDCDMLYLPFFSEPAWRVSADTVFPTKLTTYLAAGRPVLYHGPPGSAVERFFERYPAGLCCTSREPREILGALRRVAGEPGNYRRMTAAGEAARREELSAEVFKRRIAELFGFDTDLLTVPGEASMRVNGHILRDSPARRTPRQRAEPPARR